jgi:hypothetical protein
MPSNPTFRHSLMLVVRPMDTSDGTPITMSGVRFAIDGKLVFPIRKEQGNYIFLGDKREDFVLTVTVPGFEKVEKEVRYEELDPQMPFIELQMIPVISKNPSKSLLSIEGVFPGIESIDAVKLGENHVMIRDYDKRKKTIYLFNPHNLGLDCRYYAVVNPDEETYEVIEIKSRVSDDSYITEQPLAREFGNHFPVCWVVFGATSPDGRYYLRVRDDSKESRWIVRCTSGGTEKFTTIDFTKSDLTKLAAE